MTQRALPPPLDAWSLANRENRLPFCLPCGSRRSGARAHCEVEKKRGGRFCDKAITADIVVGGDHHLRRPPLP